MATLNLDILEAAHADGLMTGYLTDRQTYYLYPSVVTANALVRAVKEAGSDGLDVSQLAQRVGLHPTTILIFMRWAVSKGIVKVEKVPEHGTPNVWYVD